MKQNKERNFVCKFCSKRFPCGKSLGGHIRTHVNENSVDSDDEEEANRLRFSSNNSSGGQNIYGLRGNPKKTKRFVDQSEFASKQQMICRECGRAFNSVKALCGHMACHSLREKVVMDSQSDTETSSVHSRSRSKRITGNLQSSSPSFAFGNSSSVSEIEQEQEELAMCLMMLSRDSSFKKGNNFSSVAESSDNNSVILEIKSCSVDMMIHMKNGGECGYNADALEMKRLKENNQLKSVEDNGALLYDSDNSDSGYFRNGPKKVESDVFIDGSLKNFGLTKPEVEFGSKDLKEKSVKRLSKAKPGAEFDKDFVDCVSKNYELRKSERNISYTTQKKRKTCDFSESDFESGESSLELDPCANTNPRVSGSSKIQSGASKKTSAHKRGLSSKRKSKGHECPICFRLFRSGQALGGHKRTHSIGNQENGTVIIQEQEITKIHGLIDLNLPAPVDE